MVLKQFRYLVALAQEQHFGRAAMRCGVSQPTLSTALRGLEDELGVPLIRRGQRFIDFTAEGRRVLEWAERILADQDAMVQELSEMRGDLRGRLRIGIVPTAVPVVARLTAPFCAAHPHVTVSARSQSSVEIQKGLDDFEIELGITYLDNEPVLRARALPLYREHYSLLVPADAAIADRDRARWAEAAALKLCLLSSDMQNRRIIDSAFEAAGHHPEPQIETNSVSALALHVQTGRWSSIVPSHLLTILGVPDGTKALPLVEPEIARQIGVVVAEREPTAPTAKALLRIVEGIDERALLGGAIDR